MNNIIEFQNVSFRYDSDTETPLPRVIEHLDFSVRRGEFVAVLGHNGSGKSTLAKLCNAILLPEEGHVLVDGMDTADEAMKYEIRQTVGMVFQNPDNQIVATIVEEDVAFGPENLGVDPREIRQRVMMHCGLWKCMTSARRSRTASPAGRSSVLQSPGSSPCSRIASCLTSRPLCSTRAARGGDETIRRLNREKGITIVLITHFMDEAARAGRVVVMDNGEILMDGAPHTVFSKVEELKRVGLDVPQAAELVDELRREGWALPPDILTVEECVDALASQISDT